EFHSSRAKIDYSNITNMMVNSLKFRGLQLVGGDDHSKQAGILARAIPIHCRENHLRQTIVSVIALPKSIDGDFRTVMMGFSSAADDARRAFYNQGNSAWAHDRISLNNSMGRDAGW